MKKLLFATLLSLSCLSLTACSHTETQLQTQTKDNDLIANNYAAADRLSFNHLSKTQPVLVATLVDIDNLEASSTFGRISSEQMASRLTQSGFSVIEMKLRNSVFIKENSGEFVLSRELINLSQQHDAQAVLAGTYAVGHSSIWVTSKLIRVTDGVILASYDYVLPLGPDTKALLRNKR